MKRYLMGLLLCSLTGISMAQSNARTEAVNAVNVHTITLPLDRAVYQRVNDQATLRLAGQLRTIRMIDQVQYKVEKLDKYGNVTGIQTDWTSLPLGVIIITGGLFSTTLNNIPTGWYNVQIRTRSTGNQYEPSAPVKFGVGEVLFFAGQSNAQGVPLDLNGRTPILSGTPYDCISAVNQDCWCKKTYDFPKYTQLQRSGDDGTQRIAPNNNLNVWCYEALGRKLVDEEEQSGKVVPIVFFNAAYGGVAITPWKESIENPNSTDLLTTFGPKVCDPTFWNSEGSEGHPYRGLKTSLNYYGGMLGARGVIWHQGESDTQAGTSQNNYAIALKKVIDQTRIDFASNLSWAVSRVSRLNNSTTSSNIINGQENARNNTNGPTNTTTWGAYYSDNISDRFDQLHFNSQGLVKLADLYATGTFSGNSNSAVDGNILGMTAINAQLAPALGVNTVNNGSSSQVTLSVPQNYSSYCWVKGTGKMNQCETADSGTPWKITIPNSGIDTDWRCYVTNSTGQTTISQSANLPLPRVSISDLLSLISRIFSGGTGSFKVNSDRMDWTVSNVPSWVTLNTTQGSDGQTQVNVTFQPNSGPERSATLVVSGVEDASRQEVFISQQGTGTSCPNTGSISYQRWNNIGGGTTIQDLRNNTGNLSNAPSVSQSLTLFEAPADIADNYGVRIRGYVCPPTTGNYTFWVAGDDNAELWISPNDQPANLSRIAYHTAWTPSREWGWFGTQQSAPITLQAGQRYYVEALMKEGGGGDNLAVGWQLPGGALERPIPGNRLIPFAGGGGCTPPGAPTLSAYPGSINSGESSTLTATNCSGTVNWSTGSTFSSITVSPGSTTTYTATCTAGGCTSSSGSVTVTVGSSGGGASCSAEAIECSGNQSEVRNYTVSASGAGTYNIKAHYRSHEGSGIIRWSVNGGSVQTVNVNQTGVNEYIEITLGTASLNSGNNTVNLSSGSSFLCFKKACIQSGSGGCTPPGAPTLSAIPSSINSGESSTLTSTNCAGTVNWSTGSTFSSITVSPGSTTTYTATCTVNGCTSNSGSVTVTVGSSGGGASCSAESIDCSGNQFEVRNYTVSASGSGTYTIKAHYRSHEGSGIIRWSVNGGSVQTVNVNQTGVNEYIEITLGTASLNLGNNTVNLSSGQSYICFKKACIQSGSGARVGAVSEVKSEPQIVEDDNTIQLYPNPSDGKLTLRYNLEKGRKASLHFMTVGGSVLLRKTLTGAGGWQEDRTDLSNQPDGTYLLRFEDDRRSVTRKFIIVK